MPSRGTSIQGSRAAHSVTTPGLHASDLEAGAPQYHLVPGAIVGQFALWDGSEWLAAQIVCAGGDVVTSGGEVVWQS